MHPQHALQTTPAPPWNPAQTKVALAIARYFAARGSRVLGLAQADREDLRHDILLAMLLRAPRYDSARSRWSTFNALLARHAVADRIRTSRIGMRPAMVVLEPETHAGCASATSPLLGDELGEVTLRLDLLSVAAELPARLRETLRLLIRHDDAGAAWRSSTLVKAPNTGLPIQSPWLAIVNRQPGIARKLAAELALPPARRSRAALPPWSKPRDGRRRRHASPQAPSAGS